MLYKYIYIYYVILYVCGAYCVCARAPVVLLFSPFPYRLFVVLLLIVSLPSPPSVLCAVVLTAVVFSVVVAVA